MIVATTTVKGFEYGMILFNRSCSFSFIDVFGRKPKKTDGI